MPSSLPISLDLYRRSTPNSAVARKECPPQKTRRRGIVLTEQGFSKLSQAQVLCNEVGDRYSYEYLSELTQLDPRTICRIIGCEVGVDRRTLKTFFNSFNLELESVDYTIPKPEKKVKAQRELEAVSPLPQEELAQLKQRITSDCCRLVKLLKLDEAGEVTLSMKFSPQASLRLELHLS